jgi:hypothetical protein
MVALPRDIRVNFPFLSSLVATMNASSFSIERFFERFFRVPAIQEPAEPDFGPKAHRFGKIEPLTQSKQA